MRGEGEPYLAANMWLFPWTPRTWIDDAVHGASAVRWWVLLLGHEARDEARWRTAARGTLRLAGLAWKARR